MRGVQEEMNDDQFSTLHNQLRAVLRLVTKLNERQRAIELNQRRILERLAVVDEGQKIILSLEADDE